MYAVIKTGGKQYRVAKDDRLAVERLPAEPGTMIALSPVLMIGEAGKAPTVGTPVIDKAAVFAEVLEQGRGDKIIVFKKKRRQNYRRKNGHRQDLTMLKILEVSPTGEAPQFTPTPKKVKVAPKPAVEEDDGDVKPAKKAPAKKATAKKAAAPKKAAAKKPAKTKSKE